MSEPTISNAAYQQFLNEHKLMGSRCVSCSSLYLPPRPLCPNCHSESLAWVPLSASGTLVAFTTVHIGLTVMQEAGYGREKPYCAGIVHLEDGPSISAQILDVDAGHPEGIKIGTPLKAAFINRGEGDSSHTILAFRPVNGP